MEEVDGAVVSRQTLLNEITALEDVQTKLAANEVRDDDGFRMELVTLRRTAWEHIARIKSFSRAYFKKAGKPEIKKEFNDLLSCMDKAQFEHQKKWRGLDVDHSDPEYCRSVAGVMRANREFTTWARTRL